MSVVLMSKRELNRIDILARLESGRLTPGAAAVLLQVSERQVYRLRRRFRDGGPAGVADRRRGRPSNNRLPDVLRNHAIALVREGVSQTLAQAAGWAVAAPVSHFINLRETEAECQQLVLLAHRPGARKAEALARAWCTDR